MTSSRAVAGDTSRRRVTCPSCGQGLELVAREVGHELQAPGPVAERDPHVLV